MKLDMNFSFDTTVPGDEGVMKKVCDVLSGNAVDTPSAAKPIEPRVEKPDEKTEPKVEPAKEPEAEKTPAVQQNEIDPMNITESEMMNLDTSVLLSILDTLGIDPNKTSGKNTNKKLRDLILLWQKTEGKSAPAPEEPADDDDDDEAEEAPAKQEESGQEPEEALGYEEAKLIIQPFFADVPKRAKINELMVQYGACDELADGTKKPRLSALKDKGESYSALVEAVKNAKYGK